MLNVLYGATILLSSFLLFQVQPIIGKIILPRFGGSAGTWLVCLLFFQTVLFLGYCYSHALTRMCAQRVQGWLHVAFLVISAGALPWALRSRAGSVGDDPIVEIILVLFRNVGLPYFMLSTTGPLLQAWFGYEQPGRVPYRLFALSNFGSMLALLSYPFVVEPKFSLGHQAEFWLYGYTGFVALAGALAARVGTATLAGFTVPVAAALAAPIKKADVALWVALSASASILLLASTSHITQDIAPIPMLWVLPLALYLASFMLCFESQRWYRPKIFLPLFVIAVATLTYVRVVGSTENFKLEWVLPAVLLSSFVLFMTAHGELARLKPDPRHLTFYYLLISVGGIVGGLLVGVVAPTLFNNNYELAISILALAITVMVAWWRDPTALIHRLKIKQLPLGWPIGSVGVLAICYFMAQFHYDMIKESQLLARNFYGSLRVVVDGNLRSLYHGTILHGEQFLLPEMDRWPTTYYGRGSGAEKAILLTRSGEKQKVGMVGLGAGTLVAYGRKGDDYKIYEINPLMVAIARDEFTFLRNSPAHLEVVMGDARLSLEREEPQNFDTLLVDAFSGDSIPIHLLTVEAVTTYLRQLRPGGVLAVHVSNQYLDLAPVVRLAAEALHWQAVLVQNQEDEAHEVDSADWVLVSEQPLKLPSPDPTVKNIAVGDTVKAWTDDKSSLYPIIPWK